MKHLILFVFLTIPFFANHATAQISGRITSEFDSSWRFILGDTPKAYEPVFDDTSWRLLDLPHDWSIEGTVSENATSGGDGGYLPMGIGWYRKHFVVKKSDLKMNHTLLFDGVYMNSEVWLNGSLLGNFAYGYNSFYFDLNKYLKEGNNIVAVRVDNSKQPASRWYSGSGIYRHVWLIKTNQVRVPQWGIYVTTPEIGEKSATVSANIKLENTSSNSYATKVVSNIIDDKGLNVGFAETTIELNGGLQQSVNQKLTVLSPALWSVDSPVLYTLVTKVIVNNKTVDEVKTPFGIRSISYDVDKGFLLNGKQVKMNGVCLHHEAGAVGSAVPIKIWERRFKILKEMGCNAIRCSHNPPAPEFLDLCDKMGFLVMDEIFDEWKLAKRPYAYNIYFDQWWEKDLKTMIYRDRNHPSIVIWSTGNEIPEQSSDTGPEILKNMINIFHAEDSTRPVTLACDNIAADTHTAREEFLNLLDIVGYNYVDRWHERRELYYSIDRHKHPQWKMIGTENSSNSSIRGNYSLGADAEKITPNYNTRMIQSEQLWKFTHMNDYVCGDFMWTGFDYLGETRWPSKNSTSGVIDLCGFPKDGYYFYQSQWTKTPMLYIFPHWNWEGKEGRVLPVLAYTNCDAVELFVNGKSFGEKRMEFPRQGTSKSWNNYEKPQVRPTTSDLHLSWDVPYQPGTIKAVGKKDGKIVCTQIIETTGKPSAIRITGDTNQLKADNQDIAHVKIEIVDDKGRVVPVADNLINWEISGDGQLFLDNGNPTDHELYTSGKRKVFNGLGLAIVKAGKTQGKIMLTATSEGMKDQIMEFVVVK